MTSRALVVPAVLLCAACTVGPDHVRPQVAVPAAWKERATEPWPAAGWKEAQPNDQAPRGRWWEVFGDPGLNALEEQLAAANLTIAQAEAQYRGARAFARQARAGLFPSLGVSASAGRAQATRGVAASAGGSAPTTSTYQVVGQAAWEPDLFGGGRRNLESGVSSAQAAAAQLEALRLAIQAQLAADWWGLHGVDAQKQLLDSTVAGYQTALDLTTNRHRQGVVSGVDVAQAQTQLETTRAQATDLGIARAQLEHAIAVLLGKAPADFSIPPAPIQVTPPRVPLVLPSELLERRPDIAAAERRVAAANAQVGVATSAFFPAIGLSATGGWQGAEVAGLFSLPNRIWSLGIALAESVFDAGRRRAVKDEAVASWEAAVDAYKLSVLTAFQDVEDGLVAVRVLEQEAEEQARAVEAAERSLAIAKNRYQAGIANYLEVVTAQNAALANERTAVDLLTRRMDASVSLVKALGGGWTAADLPTRDGVLSRRDASAAPSSGKPPSTAP